MFNILAQGGTAKSTIISSEPLKLVYGNGSDLCNEEAMKKKAKQKFVTNSLMLQLVKIAEEDGNNKLQRAFWNTYYCHNKIKTSGGRSFGDCCKNRFCTLCTNNRRAEILRLYLPVIKKWKDPHFVTLTLRAPKAANLQEFMKRVDKTFKTIHRRIKQRHKRGKANKLVCVRSIECNFNPMAKTYNPHIHMIIEGYEMGILFARLWLKTWTKEYTYYKGQNIKKIQSRAKALVETIKYGTKIFSKFDPSDKSEKAPKAVYLAAMYNIIKSMKGLRQFQSFGFTLPKAVLKTTKSTVVKDIVEWEYDPQLRDWVNKENTKLTNYLPDSSLIAMLTSSVNTNIE